MKNPLTPAGIEPATYRFVAQHLNHCATAVPKYRTAAHPTLSQCRFLSRPLVLSYSVPTNPRNIEH